MAFCYWMKEHSNLKIIGSSHISSQSVDEIKKAFSEFKPDIVGVELDKRRVHALLSEEKRGPSFYDIRRIGFKGYLFAVIGSWASKKLGKIVGVEPGTEMKTAVLLAKEKKVRVALIDQPIEITLKKFSRALSWKERWNFIVDIFKGAVLRKKDPLLNFDLSKVPSQTLIDKMISRVRERYPNIYKVLIEERNYYMARKLKMLISEHPDKKILVIIGAGHKEGILRILKENEGISYTFSVTH